MVILYSHTNLRCTYKLAYVLLVFSVCPKVLLSHKIYPMILPKVTEFPTDFLLGKNFANGQNH
jgi:hypothetical protein